MKWSYLWTAVLTVTVATTVTGQTPEGVGDSDRDVAAELDRVIQESGVVVALDSVVATTAPVLDETLSQLSATLGELAARIAADPELRRSALAAAQGVAQLTSNVVAENADVIEELLSKAADELDRMSREMTDRGTGATEAPGVSSSTPGTEIEAAPAP